VIETSGSEKYLFCFEYGFRDAGDDFIELKYNNQYIDYQ